MEDVRESPESWLMKAAEARVKAQRMRTSYGRALMLEEAAKYERLAEQASALPPMQQQPVTKS